LKENRLLDSLCIVFVLKLYPHRFDFETSTSKHYIISNHGSYTIYWGLLESSYISKHTIIRSDELNLL
jgi:hypothetical protein